MTTRAAGVTEAGTGLPAKHRSHARQNLARVLAAAEEIFAADGLEASIPRIAERAGVGKATVYRSFPTKGDLVAAVASSRLDWLVERFRCALQQQPSWDALVGAFEDVAVRASGDRCLSDAIHSGAVPRSTERLQILHAAVDALVARAQDEGSCRRDVEGRDVRLLVTGCIDQLRSEGIGDPAGTSRYVRLVLDAFRT